MNEQLFDVVFFGILQAGKDKTTAMQNMASLFKTEAAKVAPYFAGGRKVIKGRINAAAAEKYRIALENVGLVIRIEPCQIESDKHINAKPTADTKTTDTGSLSLAPAGADVIENPLPVAPQVITGLSGISIAEVGADVIEHPVTVPAQKIDDISHITLAEAGADVLDHRPEVVAQHIGDISAITLAEAGADLIINPPPEKKAVIADTSELSLDDRTS